MAWHKVYDTDSVLTDDTFGLVGTSVRQTVDVSAYSPITPASGTKIRLTVKAGTGGTVADGHYAGHRASSGDPVDMDGGQVEVKKSSSSGATVGSLSSVVLDETNFTWDGSKAFVASVHFSGSSTPKAASAPTTPSGFHDAFGSFSVSASDVSPSSVADQAFYFSKLEVFDPSSEGPPTVTINQDPTQIDPSSGHAVRFQVIFNKAVTGFTDSDVDLSTSTAGSLTAVVTADPRDDTGQLYIVTVTGMTTVGDVIATIPSGRATDGVDTNTASTSTDNTIRWDPTAPPGELAIAEISMVTPTIMCVTVKDKMFIKGYVTAIEPTESVDDATSGPNTGSGIDHFGWHGPVIDGRASALIGPRDEDGFMVWARVEDIQPTAADYLDRDAADDVAEWSISGGVTISAVYRQTQPYAAGFCKGHTGFFQTKITVSEHDIHLVLSEPLEPGTYTITCGDPNVPPKTIVYSDETVRGKSLRFTQHGHRPDDIEKRGYVGYWLPKGPNEGALDIIGDNSITSFEIRDANNVTVLAGTPVLRTGPTDVEENLFDQDINIQFGFSGTAGLCRFASAMASSQIPVKSMSFVDGDPVVITTGAFGGSSVSHGLENGDVIIMRDLADSAGYGPYQFHWCFLKVANKTATTFELENVFDSGLKFRDNSSPVPHGTGQIVTADASHGGLWMDYGDSGFHTNGVIHKTHLANRAATYVYECDYSAITSADLVGKTGPYHAYVPGIGISDTFRMDDAVWYDKAHLMAKGEYHHRLGIELDGRFGWTRGIAFKGGVTMDIVESKMPYFIGDLSYHDVSGRNHVRADYAHLPLWSDGTTTTFGGSVQDAGDYVQRLEGATVYGPLMFADMDLTIFQNADFGRPKCHEILDPVVYDLSTNAFPDLLSQGIFQIDCYRDTQKVGLTGDDAIWNGAVFSGLAMGTSTGTNILEPSFLYSSGASVYAPEVYSNFIFAGGAAKIAQVLDVCGYSALSAMWLQSAQDAWDWSEAQWASFWPVVENGGTGYGGADLLTVTGGTSTAPMKIRVEAVSGGVITKAHIEDWGDYSVTPSEPVSVTGGNGTSATFTVHFGGACDTFNRVTLDWAGCATAVNTSDDPLYANNAVHGEAWDHTHYSGTLYNMHRDAADGRRYAAGCLFRMTQDSVFEDVLRENIDVDPAGLTPNGFMEYIRSSGTDSDLVDHFKNAIRTKATTNFLPFSFGSTCYRHGEIKNYGIHNYGSQGGDMGIWEVGMIINAHQISLMDDDEDTQPLIALQANMTFLDGANQAGKTHTTGLGVRPMTSFMPDVDATGEDTPIGVSCYGFGPVGQYQTNIFNFATGPFSFITEHANPDEPGTQAAADFEVQRTLDPVRYCVPVVQASWESQYCLGQRERTIQQCVVPAEMVSYYLSSFDGNDASEGLAAATTSIESSNNPSDSGETVLFTATVSGDAGTPTGTITFKDGATTLGTDDLDEDGVATYSTSALSVGSHTIIASYGGDEIYNTSSDSLTQVVESGVVIPQAVAKLRLRVHA